MAEPEPTLFRVTWSRIVGGTLFASAAGTWAACAIGWLVNVLLSSVCGFSFGVVQSSPGGQDYGAVLFLVFGIWSAFFLVLGVGLTLALHAGGLMGALGAAAVKEKLRGVGAVGAGAHVALAVSGLAASAIAAAAAFLGV